MEHFLSEKQQPYGYYKKMSKFHQTGCFVLGRSNHIPAHHYHLPQCHLQPLQYLKKAHTGDLCVFKFGLEWQLGRILPLSRYNAETGKYDKICNDQSVEDTKHVGALCYGLSLLGKLLTRERYNEQCDKSRWYHHLQPYHKANKKVFFDSKTNFDYRRLLKMFIIHRRNFISIKCPANQSNKKKHLNIFHRCNYNTQQ